jgi:hypothetical protein
MSREAPRDPTRLIRGFSGLDRARPTGGTGDIRSLSSKISIKKM